MTAENADQILIDDEYTKYYLLRARCDVCKTKTWHFFLVRYYEEIRVGEPVERSTGISNCIEHSMADDYDRYRATYYELNDEERRIVKTLKEGQSFSFELKVDPDHPFIKQAYKLVDDMQQKDTQKKEPKTFLDLLAMDAERYQRDV